MAREIGNNIGLPFWETIAKEHGLDQIGHYNGTDINQREKIDVYFQEQNDNHYVPRAILVDRDTNFDHTVRSQQYSQLFRHDNIISGKGPSNGTWFTECHDEDAELAQHVLDTVRREAERCDCLQGFQISHSVAGGSGGGMAALVLPKLREEYPNCIVATFSTMPSKKVSQGLIEAYNAGLAIHHLTDFSDQVFCFDNEALHDICTRELKIAQPTYAHLNHLVSMAMSGISAPFRFSGQLNSDLRKMAMNHVTFPRLHFLSVAHAPLTNMSSDAGPSHKLTALSLTRQLLEPKNLMTAGESRNGHHLASSATIRGRVSVQEIEDQLRKSQHISRNMQTSYCSQIAPGLDMSGTLIANSTAIQHVFKRLHDEFNYNFRRKRWLRSYISMTGCMDEMEFTEALSNLDDLVLEYEQCNAQSLE
ncbi:hypothetical protein G7054_g11992 [Neopestalotiopsis clavispora]|nr:hypothetical protein G7054_g11992 [Neopestalotiopsis clavispora]